MSLKQDIDINLLPIGELKPDPGNPRRISDQELESLTRSIREFGMVDPIIARSEDKTVIGGQQSLVAARRLGLKQVPVVLVDLSLEQARLLNLALNRISGSWDQELLARLLSDLNNVPKIDLTLSGFSDDELKKHLQSLEAREKRERIETFDVEQALEAARAAPIAKRGDLWRLGEHRLLCGDATDSAAVGRLFGDQKASLLATDPPYLVDYSGGNHPASRGNKGKANRDKDWDTYVDPEASVEFYAKFLALGLEHLKPNSAVYQWHAHRRQMLVEQAWVQCGLLVHQQIIWMKARGVLTHSHYLWSHEPAFYGWVEGQPPTKKPPSNQRTVWELDQQGSSMGVHPTQKPLELFLRPIEYHTEYGDIFYEPFLGSGTQLIAAEKLSRICYALEQGPQYVDVAIKRWEAFTGETAVKEEEQ
ncbi:MAG: site-specific DNA-methyltransferase [Dehalococcoidia bacterium]